MLTLDVLDQIELIRESPVQKIVGNIIRANHAFPPTRTQVTIEGIEHLDSRRPMYIAMNHTDRYNYWPFQVRLWRELGQFTATWVKGKYYNHPIVRKFMISANNIPTPSKGYVIAQDIFATLGEKPTNELYRAVKEYWDTGEFSGDSETENRMQTMRSTRRSILGYDFEPNDESYQAALGNLFDAMMDRFVVLNEQAFDCGLQVLVFPEGTRSVTLSKGRTGLAQMLLRTKASVVCVGCNGSDDAYPGNNPFSRGGKISYRVSAPLTPEGALSAFQIDAPYRPFTDEAFVHESKFEACTDRIMQEISSLLDPRYLSGDETAVQGASRFM